MRMKLSFLASALFAIIGRVGAGSIDLAPKESVPPTITQSRAVAIYDRSAWLAIEHEWDNRGPRG